MSVAIVERLIDMGLMQVTRRAGTYRSIYR